MFMQMNEAFIIAAYSISWIVVLGFLARLSSKGKRVRAEYDRMASDARGAGS